MVKKVHTDETDADAAPPFSNTVKESAGQIWLAGLGAFAKAQEEGTRMFDALVKEGLTLQRKTQAGAEEKISEASGRMASMATDISSRATGQWDKLENLFEERVSKAMKKLGVPSARDIEALAARVEALEARLGSTASGTAPAPRRATGKEAEAAGEPPARRSARKPE